MILTSSLSAVTTYRATMRTRREKLGSSNTHMSHSFAKKAIFGVTGQTGSYIPQWETAFWWWSEAAILSNPTIMRVGSTVTEHLFIVKDRRGVYIQVTVVWAAHN